MDAPKNDNTTFQIDNKANDNRVEKSLINFGKLKDLREISKEWQFFTPALLYLFGRFSDEPIARYIDETGVELQLAHYKFNRAVFEGMKSPLGNSEWDHVLWAVPKPQWATFEQYLISIVLVNYKMKTTFGVGSQDLVIIDPLFLDQHTVLPADVPRLPVVVLGVNGSHNCIAMDTATENTMDRPKVKRYPPQDYAVAYANALFSGSNPTAAAAENTQTGTNSHDEN